MDRYDAVVADWNRFRIPEVVKRDYELDIMELKDFIITISGPRRVGKTYFMFQMIHELMENEGVDRENIFYVNLEDDRLFPFTTGDMDALVERYQESADIKNDHDIFLFLDEIQNIEGWSAWVRRVHDLRKDIRLVLTGSSSKLLGKEIASNLRGRVINTTIYPVSFSEYISWKGIAPVKKIPSGEQRVALRQCLNSYAGSSAFPQILFGNYKETTEQQILQGYYEVMLLRDIIERYNVRKVNLFRTLGKFIFASISREFSYNKQHNSLKSMGINISKSTIIEYVNYFEDVFLFFRNSLYSSSYKAQISSIKKIYCIDTGLVAAVSFRSSADRGRFLENMVYIELKRRRKEIYYHRNPGTKLECDFIVKEGLEIVHAIQVCASLHEPSTRKREIAGLMEGMAAHRLDEGFILTETDFEDVEQDGKRIRIRPIWYWLQTENGLR